MSEAAKESRTWAMFLHFSLLAGYLIPFGGLLVPIIIWQMKKSEFPEIDQHGKIVVNWMISAAIYGFLSFLLTFALIGVPLLIVLGILGVVFPIIGGIKANAGEVWKYPLSIKFLS